VAWLSTYTIDICDFSKLLVVFLTQSVDAYVEGASLYPIYASMRAPSPAGNTQLVPWSWQAWETPALIRVNTLKDDTAMNQVMLSLAVTMTDNRCLSKPQILAA